MDPDADEPTSPSSPAEMQHSYFRLFTRESLVRIDQRIEEEKKIKEAAAKKREETGQKEEKVDDEDKPKANPKLEQGNKVPKKFGEFPKELIGKPIEDFDPYYANQYTFVVVGKDSNIYRFSATKAFYLLTPFNPLRRAACYTLSHPFFNLFVMFTILVNCGFMCVNAKDENGKDKFTEVEYVFTAIYTCEMLLKMTARGFILKICTYLRDMWNWLDFIVVTLAYITEFIDLGNLAALRTFRVLRALKTVAVMPGLKTIVGALMEAVRRLRDVMILTCFVLSIFALIGLQVYSGRFRQKCIRDYPEEVLNISRDVYKQLREDKEREWQFNEVNWYRDENNNTKICGAGASYKLCPEGWTVCEQVGENPNFGFTHFDHFGGAMLCAFRLMTQDYWENLYQITIKTNGPLHMGFFVIVILLGSFYLVNLILAIVAMSYDEVRKANKEEEEEEQEARNSPSKKKKVPTATLR